MIENMQEENEQNLLHQETTNGFIDEKIKLLEEAFNLTVAKIDEHKVGSTACATKNITRVLEGRQHVFFICRRSPEKVFLKILFDGRGLWPLVRSSQERCFSVILCM
jgi:hypothetical protein